MAELEAILEGISVCNHMGVSNYILETDCSMAFGMVHKPEVEQWRYTYILRQIRSNLDRPDQLRLIYREANKVADLLAKMAHTTQARIDFYRREDLPLAVQKCIFFDTISIPSFRTHCK